MVTSKQIIELRDQAPGTVTFTCGHVMDGERGLSRVIYDWDCDIQALCDEQSHTMADLKLIVMSQALDSDLLHGPIGSMVPGQLAEIEQGVWRIKELPTPTEPEEIPQNASGRGLLEALGLRRRQ